MPCNNLLVVRADGEFNEPQLREIVAFLGLGASSEREAAAAAAAAAKAPVATPESGIAFNKGAIKLLAKAGVAPKPPPMLNATRELLKDFFREHWHARFPAAKEEEPCALI